MPATAYSRRNFIKKSALTAGLIPILGMKASPVNEQGAAPLKIHIFSKHLQFLSYRDMAEAAAEMDFDGVDLTVRPKGHVLPERVEDDLPKAAEALRNAGLSPLILTTAVEDSKKALDRRVLKTASAEGFKFYRMNWYLYPQEQSMPEAMEVFRQKLKELSRLNEQLGLMGVYQNHSGMMAGASPWELWEMLKDADREFMGVQYDIRHATVEGGMSWSNGLRLIHPYIKTIVLKDFKWERQNGKWVVFDTPIGEGMVDFKAYFVLLKQYRINVPVSLHLEYDDLGGAEHGATKLSCRPEVVFEAMKKDLKKVRELWNE